MKISQRRGRMFGWVVGASVAFGGAFAPVFAQTGPSAFMQSLAAAASGDDAVAALVSRVRAMSPCGPGEADAARRAALFEALDTARDHGLPESRYDVAGLRAGFANAVTEGDRGRLELRMTETYLRWAHDMTSGHVAAQKAGLHHRARNCGRRQRRSAEPDRQG